MNEKNCYASANPTKARGFTLIEILVVITIIGILVAILIPVVGKVSENGKTAKTVSNLRQLQMANINYANDNNGTYVKLFTGGTFADGWKWSTLFLPYLSAKATGTSADATPILRSGFKQPNAMLAYNSSKTPSATGGNQYFFTNGAILALRQIHIQQPTKTIAFIDCNDWWVNPDNWNNWKSAAQHDAASSSVKAAAAYRNNGKAAAVTFAGNTVMLERKDLDKSTPDGQWRWWYDGKP